MNARSSTRFAALLCLTLVMVACSGVPAESQAPASENGSTLSSAETSGYGELRRRLPGAPGAPTFTAIQPNSVTVSWASAPRASSYGLERAPDVSGSPGTYAEIANGTDTTYLDTTVSPATAYWYRVVGINALGPGPYSAVAEVVTAAAPAPDPTPTSTATPTPTPTTSPTPTPTTSPTPAPTLATCTKLVSDTNPRATSPLAMPGYLASTTDPEFGTKITRVTGDAGTPIPNANDGSWKTVEGPEYAKTPSWSADQALMYIQWGSASGHLFLDGNDYHVVAARSTPKGANYNLWHPTQAGIMVYIAPNGEVGWWNPITNAITPKFVPAAGAYSSATFGKGEGNLSRDGRWVVVTATRTSDGAEVFFLVDIDGGTKGADMTAGSYGLNALDWASVSATGTYLVISQNYQLSKVLTHSGSVVSSFASGHYDMGVDVNGDEVAFNADSKMFRLTDGTSQLLLNTNLTDAHASNRAYLTTWGLASTVDGSFPGEEIAIDLTTPTQIRRLVHTRTTSASYDHHSFGTPSPDGMRVFYRSDWGNANGSVYGFVVDARGACQ